MPWKGSRLVTYVIQSENIESFKDVETSMKSCEILGDLSCEGSKKKNEATEPVRSDTKLRLQNFAAEELFQDHDFITAFCQCSGQPQASHTTADDNIIQILQKFFLRLLEGWL